MTNSTLLGTNLSRRAALGIGVGAALAPALSACSGVSTSGANGGSGAVNFLSTQFTPVEERQRFESILSKRITSTKVAYNPVDAGVFASTIQSQVDSNKVQLSLIGGLHGDLAPHAARFVDLGDLVNGLHDRGVSVGLTDLGKFGASTVKYVPWMQASYVLAVNKKALQWLPSGANPRDLTYDQLLAWTSAAKTGNGGKPIMGIPAGPKGLYHRFLQGFLLPSFTGGQITTFRSPEAVQAWQYMKDLWATIAPASTNYDFMQEPLQRGEVLMAWDHVARLVNAPKDKPDDWQIVPAPRGPRGLGYLLVVAGLAIPRGAPEPALAKEVIKALTTADIQLDVLRNNAFFPVVTANLPTDLPPAINLEAAAVQSQQSSSGVILSLPPVGLGAKDGEVSQIFKNTFKDVVIDKKPIQQVLDARAKELNTILDELKVPCWKPDPVGQQCRVL
jgi:multiple sugar transport system substrate-binding protein